MDRRARGDVRPSNRRFYRWYRHINRCMASQTWQSLGGGHNPVVQAIWFTIVLFIVTAVRLWRFRLRGAFSFWASLLALWTLHVIGILVYFFYFGPLMLRQWVSILVCEAFVFVFVVEWITRRFGHSRRHQYH